MCCALAPEAGVAAASPSPHPPRTQMLPSARTISWSFTSGPPRSVVERAALDTARDLRDRGRIQELVRRHHDAARRSFEQLEKEQAAIGLAGLHQREPELPAGLALRTPSAQRGMRDGPGFELESARARPFPVTQAEPAAAEAEHFAIDGGECRRER